MNNLRYEYKKVWSKKDNNTLEYKEWFIFRFIIEEPTKNKFNTFIDREINNFKQNNNLPPKIIKLNKKTASAYSFSSFKDDNNFIYGDSVSGSLQENDLTYNSYLQREIINYDYISFKPEVIINVYYTNDQDDYYIYQLEERQNIYNTFGGPIKYDTNNLKSFITKFNIIEPKSSDLPLLIPTNNFNNFIKLFQQDILTEKFNLFEDPKTTIKKYLFEKLEIYENLLTEEDIHNFIQE